MADLGRWVHDQMKSRRLTQPALAARAGVGLATVNAVLRQGHVPKAETLFRIADALGASHFDALVASGLLRRGEELAAAPEASPDLAGPWVRDILDAIHRIPDQARPQALDQLAAAIARLRAGP